MSVAQRLHDDFMNYHRYTKRQIANRDKALLRDPRGNIRDRFYLTPVQSTLVAKPRAHYMPAPDTAWQCVLYSTPILTVYPDDTALVDLANWYTNITFDHLQVLLNTYAYCPGYHYWRIGSRRPNKWTKRHYLLNGSLLFDGLRLNMATGEILNPRPLPHVVPDYASAEVKAIRKVITATKQRYASMAALHAASWRESQGRNDAFPCDHHTPMPSYETLCHETDINAETYRALAGRRRTWGWWQWYDPVRMLNRSLENIKSAAYGEYLVEK